jgi:HPt (histidine-containing phosphotransfer) domain-containing protein
MPAQLASDLEAALNAVEGDRELLHRMIQLFMTQCPHLMEQIRTALARGDGVAVQRAAHTLRGSVCNFAASRAYEAATRLEQLGREGKLANAASAQAELEETMAQLHDELVEFTRNETP